MVDLNVSQPPYKRFYLQHDHKRGNYKEYTSFKFHYDFVSFDASEDSPHLFVVDWQITEPKEGDENRDYPAM